MRIVIVGNGFAGVTALETILALEPKTQVTLVSRENRGFYSPASLFAYLEGRVDEPHLTLRDADFYKRLGVRTRFGRTAKRLNARAHTLTLDNDTRLKYDRILIATGASAQGWDIRGAKTRGVFKLDWLGDARDLMERPARRVVVAGAGRLGVELAAVLRERGAEVVLLELMPTILPGVFDADMAALIQERLTSHGVEVRVGEGLREIYGRPVKGVRTARADIPCDTVVLVMGRRPNVNFVNTKQVPLGKAGGILVDEHLQAVEDVYAAGDCAETLDFLGQRALNAVIPKAIETGRLAALNMLGHLTPYGGSINANVLIVFGRAYFSLGVLQGERVHHRSGDVVETYVLQDGRLVGAQFAGETRTAAQALQAIRRGIALDQPFTFDALRCRLFHPVTVANPNR